MLLFACTLFLALVTSGWTLPSESGTRDLEKRETCPAKYAKYDIKHIRCYQDDPDAKEVPLTQEVKDAIVAKHNKLRGSVSPTASNMQTMVWDDTLAETATKWAMQCEPLHDRNHLEPDYPGLAVSQNAARQHKDSHPSTMAAFMGAIQSFYDEVNNGAYTYGVPYTPPRNKQGAGHYLTVVHALSNRVGCGEAHCPTKNNDKSYYSQRHFFQICNYAYGNNATLPYTQGEPCGECPGHCDESNKLCDCKGKLCFNGGRVNLKTCGCDCTKAFEGDKCEKRKCPKQDPSWCEDWDLTECRYNTWLQDHCPQFCGLCPKPCDGMTCLHKGRLNVDTCKCACKSGNSYYNIFTGDRCEICPKTDWWHTCEGKTKADCTKSRIKDHMGRFCPNMCGLC